MMNETWPTVVSTNAMRMTSSSDRWSDTSICQSENTNVTGHRMPHVQADSLYHDNWLSSVLRGSMFRSSGPDIASNTSGIMKYRYGAAIHQLPCTAARAIRGNTPRERK